MLPVAIRTARASSIIDGGPVQAFPQFFSAVHLHGELTDLLGVSCLFFVFFSEFLLEAFLTSVVEDNGGFLQEFLLPVAEKVWQDVVLNGDGVKILFNLEYFENKI